MNGKALVKRAAVLNAVEKMKGGGYGVTGLKIELEANLGRRGTWGDTRNCLKLFFEKFGHPLDDDQLDELEEEGTLRNPCEEIVFAMFYNDGSVDSELTITIDLANSENVFLSQKIIEAWNEMCYVITGTRTVNVRGAGMHMAVLNNDENRYPAIARSGDEVRFANFRKSMMLMLPSLFFLAAHKGETREMRWRKPDISSNGAAHGSGKAQAIHYKAGALEYRVFDTCYENPEAVLDNVMVIANSLKFWSEKYINPHMDKICKTVGFGCDNNYTLERLYTTVTHVDLLNAGLKILKPSYKTIAELKKERNFKVSKTELKSWEKKASDEARIAYAEYEERFEWKMERSYYQWVENEMHDVAMGYKKVDKPIAIAKPEIEKDAKNYVVELRKRKQSVQVFVQTEIDRLREARGNTYFTLST